MEIAQEKIFFQDANVTVTQSRFQVADTTFAMRNISSVSNFKIEASRGIPIFLMIVGGISLLAKLWLFGACTFLIGLIWFLFLKDTFTVRISSNSGEANAVKSHSRQYIQSIVDAVNEAIINRG